MDAEPDLAQIARAVGDATRIRMLTLLMEGRAHTAKELAYGAGVGPATATAHLRQLLGAGLVSGRTQGRHKYFQLASPQVARCVESLMAVAPRQASPDASPSSPIRHARFCYDHLAGRVAIEVTQELVRQRILRLENRAFDATPKGMRWLGKFGIDVAAVASTRRQFACACLDWSERKDHLGGALGAALAQQFVARGWIRRKPGTRIAVVTKAGGQGLAASFGIKDAEYLAK